MEIFEWNGDMGIGMERDDSTPMMLLTIERGLDE